MWEVFEYLISTSLSARSMMGKNHLIGGTVYWNSLRNIKCEKQFENHIIVVSLTEQHK